MARKPKYGALVEWITQRIENQDLKPGDKLDSENDLSERFEVSRQTVRHALGILAKDGLIESRQGSGSFVTGLPAEKELPAEQPEKPSRNIVIVSTYVNGYIFPRLIQGMEKILEKSGWTIQIMFTYNHLETEKRILEKLLKEPDLAGLLIEPTMSGLPNPNVKYYARLKEMGIPILFFHSYYPELDIPHVSLDDKGCGKMATEYLLSKGHTMIGGIFKLDDGQGIRRYQGYLEALGEAGLLLREKNVIWIDTEDQRNMELCSEKILRRVRSCTACVCYNDEVAHDLTEICRQAGIRIPEDLSIVSIDNSDLARLNAVPLTSVKHPMEFMGAMAAERLLEMIKNPKFDAGYEFAPELEVRDSVIENPYHKE